MPSKSRKLWLIPLVVMIAGAAGALVWWQNYKTRPAYSVALLIDAAQRNDTAAFDELFDTDKVIDNFLSRLGSTTSPGLASDLQSSLRQGLVAAAPNVPGNIKPKIREVVRQRINELAESSGNAPFVLMALGLHFKTKMDVNGDHATVWIKRADQTLELGMLRKDDRWRVIAAKDDALAARVAAEILKETPGGLAKPLLDKLPNLPFMP